MNLARDYINFAVKFVGLGYIVMWPWSTTGAGGDVFGATLVCAGGIGAAIAPLCHLPHVLRFSVGLHMVGALFAALAMLQLVAGMLFVARAPSDTPAPPRKAPAALLRAAKARLRPLPPPRKLGKPRTEFGLRGVPR